MIKNLVLIHGFWADESSFSEIIPILEENDFTVITPQLPLTSLSDDIEIVNKTLDLLEDDCILVGHSYGGVVITNAGKHPKVKALVYIAAFVPDEDEKMTDLLGRFPATPVLQYFDVQDGVIWLKKEGFAAAFAQDLPEAQATALWASQKAPNAGILETVTASAAWKNKPSWFIVSLEDNTISPMLQRFEAERIDAQIMELPASHVPMISRPEEVSDFLISITSDQRLKG